MPYQTQLQWLVALAHIPAWKAYAWHRALELDADLSGLWTGIADDLKSRIPGPAKATESGPQCPPKPRSAGKR
jgi:hypothetical protein